MNYPYHLTTSFTIANLIGDPICTLPLPKGRNCVSDLDLGEAIMAELRSGAYPSLEHIELIYPDAVPIERAERAPTRVVYAATLGPLPVVIYAQSEQEFDTPSPSIATSLAISRRFGLPVPTTAKAAEILRKKPQQFAAH